MNIAGSYDWMVTRSFNKNEFQDMREWEAWKNRANKEFIDSFNLNKGDLIAITVDGGRKRMVYKGTFEWVSGDLKYGYTIKLQQKKQEKFISGWRIVAIEKLVKV